MELFFLAKGISLGPTSEKYAENIQIYNKAITRPKGEGYAAKFKQRLGFMQDVFVPRNNEKYGRRRFSFLYIEDTTTPEERIQKTMTMINDFFK